MGEITRQPARAIQNALIDSVLAGLCALIVFGPIVGVVLKGYGFTLAPARVAILVAVVMAGSWRSVCCCRATGEKPLLPCFEGADDGVYVRPRGLPLAAALDNTAAGGAGHCLSVSRHKISADRGHSWADLRSAWPGVEYCGGSRGPARSGLCGVLRHRRPTAWRWATSTWDLASGRCCRWGR